MPITREYLMGAAMGVGLAAAGFYLYKKNQDKIDEILRSHGLDIPINENKPLNSMGVDELSVLKERIEDLIAEKEYSAATGEVVEAVKKPSKKRAAKKVVEA